MIIPIQINTNLSYSTYIINLIYFTFNNIILLNYYLKIIFKILIKITSVISSIIRSFYFISF